MFITENQNVGDSVLFLLSARASLANIVEASSNDNKASLCGYLRNEASDYEVMHLLLKGTMPKEKYNEVAEMRLFSDLKESMLINKELVTEIAGEEIFYNLLNEVDSLYGVASTTAPVLEFFARQDSEVAVACMLNEVAISELNRHDLVARIKDFTMKARDTVDPSLKGKIMRRIDMYKSQLKSLGSDAGSALKSGYKAVKSGASDLGGKVADKAAEVGKAASKFGGKVADKAVDAKKAAVKLAKAHPQAAQGLAGAAAAAMAIYAGAKIYKRFFSQAAKSCSGQKGSAKVLCMNKYKKQAIMKQASAIQSASGKCAKSKDPGKCKAAIATKVASLKAKAAKVG